eukprot:5061993-Pyramimonas_sp.AAC.1
MPRSGATPCRRPTSTRERCVRWGAGASAGASASLRRGDLESWRSAVRASQGEILHLSIATASPIPPSW